MILVMLDHFFAGGQPRYRTTHLVMGLIMVLAGCSGTDTDLLQPDDSGIDAGVAVVADGGSARPDGGIVPDTGVKGPCQPELSPEVSEASVLPFGLFTVRATGGTGAYRFRLADNRSGAIINELSGAYLSGALEGTTDTVEITDEGCLGSAQVAISVVEQLELRPRQATVPPNTVFTFEAIGGTGQFEYRLVRDGTGAQLTPEGRYSAGANGIDRIEVEDLGTGEIAEATISVEPGTSLAADPPVMYVPAGESYALRMRGGSGFVEVANPSPTFRLDQGQIMGVRAGRSTVTVRDRFTGQTAPLTVEVLADLEFTKVRAGVALLASSMRAPGDLNGDGFADLVFAHPEASVAADRGGAVYIYAGSANGISPQPAQVIGGTGRIDELGRAVTLADFDSDGLIDLAVGVPRSNLGGSDRGIVEVYRGVPNGFFETSPYTTLSGNFGGDLLGWALTSCDFNNDGRQDIAAGAYNAEDRTRSPQSTNQGGVFIFLGHSDGFRDLPDQILWGDVPDGQGAWNGVRNMHFGISLAAGDHDGDGVCDLAAGSFEYDGPGVNDGLVYVYKGVERTDAAFGGLEDRPRRAWASTDPANTTSEFARNLAMGDVNQDGRADLLVSQHRFDAGSSDNYGAIRLFLGEPMTTTVATLTAETTASWSYTHGQSNDYFGFAVNVAEATGDDVLDLVVGSYLDETASGNQGTIRVFAGRQGGLPGDEPDLTLSGPLADDRLGQSVVSLGDVDGDGTIELAGFAYYTSDYGRNVGTPLVFSGEDSVTALELPGEAAGMRFGQQGSIVGDVTGDGFEDLLVPAPYAATESQGLFAGRVFLYRGTSAGFESTPALTFDGLPRHSAYDYMGWSVAPAGDFDRDGRPDFAIVARFEDKSTTASYGPTYAVDDGCPAGSQNNVGAIFIFSGAASGLPSTTPTFIIHGPQVNDTIREVRGGFDYNGDGYDDLAFSAIDWDQPAAATVGVVALVAGRPRAFADTTVLCGPDVLLLGNRANDQLGFSLAPVGDLNGDGCDEVVAGAPFEDPVISNEGGLRVVFGFGGAGCPAQPQMVGLRSGFNNAQAGYALDGGVDFTGDGVPDVAVGMPNYDNRGSRAGAVAITSGAAIAALPREPVQSTSRPVYRVLPTSDIVFGQLAGEAFGRSVGIFRNRGTSYVAVGAPLSDIGGSNLSGGVRVYRWQNGAFDTLEVAGFGGETSREGSLLGAWLHVGQRGGRPHLVVGGYQGSSGGIDSGSAYVLNVDF